MIKMLFQVCILNKCDSVGWKQEPDTSNLYPVPEKGENKTTEMIREAIVMKVESMDLEPDCLGSDSTSCRFTSYFDLPIWFSSVIGRS